MKNYDPKREKELQNALEGAEQVADVYKKDYESAIKEIKELQRVKTQLKKENEKLRKNSTNAHTLDLGEATRLWFDKLIEKIRR